ncbi:DNRLRE domain-containing protein [Streptomyces sp. NPDC059477]|uniref:DNRLRE domain-containing protein n=1 Tax=Streptomyces sp. NPDC059477 TaxID=3346847 RepID=UPI00368A8881
MAALLVAETAFVSLETSTALAAGSGTDTTTTVADAASTASSADSVADALLMARLQDRKIEVLSERTETSTTYALPSGQLETSTYAGPIRQQVEGTWKDIDTSLSDTGGSLEPQVAAADIAVSDGGDTALASVAENGKSFGLGWESQLPTPTVKDDTASYDLGDGRTLTVTALAQGFSQTIELDSAPDEAPEYRIPLNLDGLTLSTADSGHLLLKDDGGKLVAEAPAPMMWDSSKDDTSGEPQYHASVATSVETAADGSQTLVLTPDSGFFDQDLTYPVTVDPTSTLAVTTDTWVQTPDYTDSQVSSTELKSGTYNGGSTIARSYLKFDTSAFKGKAITDTNLSLYSFWSSSCTEGSGTLVRRVLDDWNSSTITWSTKPNAATADQVINTAAKGYSSACPAGAMNFDIDDIVTAWADGSAPNYGLVIRGVSETDSLTWRRFHSANYASGDNSLEPHLTVTYNSYPSVPSAAAISPSQVNAYSGKRYVTSLTPTLSAKVTDPDGANTKAQFEITADPAYADTTYTYTGSSASVASGSTASLAIPSASAFPAGVHLRYRVRAYDGSVYGSWSGYTTFVMNTAKPAAPTITCGTYDANAWTAKADDADTCTLDTSSADGAGYHWGLDDPSVPNRKLDTTDGNGGDALTVSIGPDDGWHTLYARTVDSGGNLSTATTAYSFGVGADGAAILSPSDGALTARRLKLAAKGLTSYTGVTWQYRRGDTDTWKNVPASDVTDDGDPLAAWPATVTGGVTPTLVWNAVGSLDEDGVIDLRAVFTDGTTTGHSQSVGVTLDRDASDAANASVGPGSVNLLTGNFTVSAQDTSAFDAIVERSLSSRANTTATEGLAEIFGPGWTSSLIADTSGSDYIQLRKTSASSVELLGSDGSSTAFTATASGWQPQVQDLGLTLSGTVSGATFTLTDLDGNIIVFTRIDSGSNTWVVSSSASAVDNSTVTVTSETVTSGGESLVRPKYVISPTTAVSASVCATAPATLGCRVLEFVYAGSTTATAGTPGDFAGQVMSIKLWATEPGASAATAETVVRYAYGSTGRLREVWDPRISPPLKTEYTYDDSGLLATLTSPGDLPWSFTYGEAGSALTAGEGMLLSASRPTLAEGSTTTTDGTATTSVVYDVPLSGTSAPNQMDSGTVAAWGQAEAPSDAAAVFTADSVPASHTGADLGPASYAKAAITYIDADGQETNTALPGGALTATDYDVYGNTVAALTAANRELALADPGNAQLQSLGLAQLSTRDRARQLSSVMTYSADGQRLLDEKGPVHWVQLENALEGDTADATLAAGSLQLARQHTVNAYDEGRPADAAVSGLLTSTTAGAYVDGYPSDADTVTRTTAYDWSTGEETTSTQEGSDLPDATTYDSAGRIATTRTAGSSGTDAGTVTYTYYTASGTGTCANRPEWAGQLCRTAPAADITGGGANPAQLPATVYAYNRWGGVKSTAESAGGTTRTTTFTYDSAGRTVKTSVSGGVGAAVADQTTTYDEATGQTATQSAGGRTISYGYDALGRAVSYDDGAGNTTTTTYNRLDAVVSITDSAPSTTTYGYNSIGQLTSLHDSVAGDFTATYDADGTLRSETLPGGLTLEVSTDPVGNEIGRAYRTSDGTLVLSDTAGYTISGQVAEHRQSDGGTLTSQYAYDSLDRLVRATDETAAGCTARDYAFDANSNRTQRITTEDDCDTGTGDAVVDTQSLTYDTADRLVSGGRAYDAFGRLTTEGDATLTYYSTDTVHTETSGTERRTWSLDPSGRPSTRTDSTRDAAGTWTASASLTNHYGAGGQDVLWTATDDGTVERSVSDILGDMAALTTATGDVVLQLTNLHGDSSVLLPLDTSLAPTVQQYDEYGNSLDGTVSSTYGWLGSLQLTTDGLAGYYLMGARLYDAQTDRFLQRDPQYNGGANAYVYCSGDGVNCRDVSGLGDYYQYYSLGKTTATASKVFTYWKNHFSAIFPIPGRPSKITKEGQKFTLWPYNVMYFPLKVNSIGKSYLQLGARAGHPDYPGGWIGFDLYKKSGTMKLEIRGHTGGISWLLPSGINSAAAYYYWRKLGANLKKVVSTKF